MPLPKVAAHFRWPWLGRNHLRNASDATRPNPGASPVPQDTFETVRLAQDVKRERLVKFDVPADGSAQAAAARASRKDVQQSLLSELKEDVARALEANWAGSHTIRKCSRLVRANPQSVSALTLRAIAYRLSGEPDRCIEDCKKILELEGQNRFALLHLISAAKSKNAKGMDTFEFVRILGESQRCAELLKNDKFALLIQGVLLNIPRDSKNYADRLENLIQDLPGDLVLLTALIAVYRARSFFVYRLDEIERLGVLAEQLLQADPSHALARMIHRCLLTQETLSPYRELLGRDAMELFADYPLKDQDPVLPGLIDDLP